MNKSKSKDLLTVCVHGTEKQHVVSPVLEESSYLDLNQFIFDDDTICDTMFGEILDSSQIHARDKEAIIHRPDSPPIFQVQCPAIDRYNKPYYPPTKPLPQTITYTHSVLDTDPSYEQSVTAHPLTHMTVSTLCSPTHQTPLYVSCCVKHQPQSINRSSLKQRHYTYPDYQATHTGYDMCSHTCTCRNNTAVYSAAHMPCYSHSPIQSGECPYSPVATRRSLSQPVSTLVNDHCQSYCTRAPNSDQFISNTPNSNHLIVPVSDRNTLQASPPNNLPHTACAPVCGNCGYENSFVESRECESYTQSCWEIQSETTCRESVSTQELNDCLEDSVCSSQITATQDSSFSETSSQQTVQSPFDYLSREGSVFNSANTDRQRNSRSQKRKEQKKLNNERERKRLCEINRALKDLGDVCCFHTHERAHTKVGTIEQAVAIISIMQTKLAYKKAAEENTKPS